MRKYDKEFNGEAVKLSDEVGVKQSASQLGIPYYSLSEWRQKRKSFEDHAFVGGGIHRDAPLSENERRLVRENAELKRPMRFSGMRWIFSPKTGRNEAGTVV